MKYRITQIKTNIDISMSELPSYVARAVGIKPAEIIAHEVRRKSIDSRKKPHVQYVYTVDFDVTSNARAKLSAKVGRLKNLSSVEEAECDAYAPIVQAPHNVRPIVVGMGPCGLFAGLELARQGLRPIIIERGPAMNERIEAVEAFNRERILDPEANMLFGEGGAGTFSDGKIGTGIRDSLIRDVLRDFRDAGAGDDIMYLAKPHIGTDVLREVIVNLRNKIEELGGEVCFNTRLDSFLISSGRLEGIIVSDTRRASSECDEDEASRTRRINTSALILAIGHSARDTFKLLHDNGFNMEPKPFSIGVRMQHPQAMIDASQYGEENVGKLPPADYKLSYKASNGRGVYSFCMCPGGQVVTCTTKEGELCVNGMSNRKRDSGDANSGILCDVRISDFASLGAHEDAAASSDPLAGVRFQEYYERLAYINGMAGGNAKFTPPSCNMGDFLEGCDNARGVIASLPTFASEAIREAVPHFGRIIEGYDRPDADVIAVETRSSSPVRILRNENGLSNIEGVYPAGEGAGYAGGITSAACDGIRAARHLMAGLMV